MFLLLFFLFLLNSPLYADDFNLSGNGILNQYYQTTGMSIGEFPSSLEKENSVIYDVASTFGSSTEDALQNNSIFSLTQAGNMGRITKLIDSVKGPPGTIVNILYYFYNGTGHSVEISKIVVPFSREDLTRGNLVNLLDFDNNIPVFGNVRVQWGSYNLRKEGMLKEYSALGVLSDGLDGALILDELRISNPITIDSIEMEDAEGGKNIKVLITNRSSELLNNIYFEHNFFSSLFDMLPSEQISVEYFLSDSEDLGYFKITNPNTKTECAIYGSKYNVWTQMSAVTVLAFREDGGWVNGAYVQPERESFCITRLPYSMTSPLLGYEKLEDDDSIIVEECVEAKEWDNNIEVKEDEYGLGNGLVLGVSEKFENNFVLPKTAKKIY